MLGIGLRLTATNKEASGPPEGNLLANGTFDDSTGWSLTAATVSGGTLNLATGGFAFSDLSDTIPNGSTVRVTMDLAGGGDLIVSLNNNGSNPQGTAGWSPGTGVFKDIVVDSDKNRLIVSELETDTLALDNITVEIVG